MTNADVYPLNTSDSSQPPVANTSHNASNEFWQQINTAQLQEIVQPKTFIVYFLIFFVCFLVYYFSVSINNKKYQNQGRNPIIQRKDPSTV